jgi:hypothetical protein
VTSRDTESTDKRARSWKPSEAIRDAAVLVGR